MAQQRALRIGITIGIRSETEGMWVNGIKQNALYLAKLFQHSPLGHSVAIVNTTSVALTGVLPWDTARFPVRQFEDVKDALDVLIELGGQISEEQTRYLKARGTKLVSYCCGPEYVQMMEAMIFNRRLADTVFINQQYDAVWAIPQVMETTASFLGTLRRVPVCEVPFVWDPMCLNMRTRDLPFEGEYRPREIATPDVADRTKKRLTVMEPNIDVLKFCLYPLLIAEQAFRSDRDAIAHLHVTNAKHLARHSPEFIGIAQYLDIVKAGKASFVGRYETPQFLSEHTDIVISHQWGLALNYFYFDACWNGFALVHNAQLCREIGYYYEGNDVEAGARQLVHAIRRHDDDWQSYRAKQRKAIVRFLATNLELIARYDELLEGLFATDQRE
ncbi:DUF2827 domain-containing protein [Paraburkholderia edwinii]|jgi:hypothetical protein|uniref:DUF2827 domain-containing protein n=1 Tax=Paraburkholderia edwinii TaxID=2861782 RepID=A0ABX8USZ7_9BURK|nr:DUF2827 domain-containing protein [Paraburkholderia edwinii]QYD71921.1 DUF2827 domain-containing protein [Paraburkholderia edwinii]